MKETLDTETVVNRVVAIVQANINSKLSAIDTEKNDFTLKPFSAPGATGGTALGAYAILSMDAQVMNFDPFLFVGAMQPTSTGLGPGTATEHYIDLVSVLYANGADTNMWKRLLRYQRALKEIIQENWHDAEIPGDVVIESLEPRLLEELGTKPYMGVGVRVKTTIA